MDESCETWSGRDPFRDVVSKDIWFEIGDDVEDLILQVDDDVTGLRLLCFVASASGTGRAFRGDLNGEQFLAGDVRAVRILTWYLLSWIIGARNHEIIRFSIGTLMMI